MTTSTLAWTFIIVGGCCLIAALPLATIWSLNTLFGVGVTYTFWTWLAALVLLLLTSGRAAFHE